MGLPQAPTVRASLTSPLFPPAQMVGALGPHSSWVVVIGQSLSLGTTCLLADLAWPDDGP